jgi:NADH-quinone oxidoreductase subunit F
MDLHLGDAVASAAERAALDDTIGPALPANDRTAVGGQAARARRSLLLGGLWALQRRVGWISPGGLQELCARLSVPPAEAYGVASFYDLFALEARPARVVHVCDDLACRRAGAEDLLAAATGHDATDVSIRRAPCLGRCEAAPAALVVHAGERPVEVSAGRLDAHRLAGLLAGSVPVPDEPGPVVRSRGPMLARVGVIDPTSLAEYRLAGGYDALRRAIELGPQGVLDALAASGLAGRGGAAFPTARKWAAVAGQPVTPHHLVCNADESEPGTFKDRVLCEGDPFAVVEAMTIAALTTGCERGWIYLRGEYPLARTRLAGAIEAARRAGLLGDDVAASGRRFDLEVVVGAGAYICGEETAIFNSIEGYRGEPRNKPPFPVESGLFGRPTVVNNVETLAAARAVLAGDGATTKLLCVSGAVERPGVYEVPMPGTTLTQVLERAGGGSLQAVLVGGAAGTFLRPDAFDVELSVDALRRVGGTLGSGVVLAVGVDDDLGDLARRIARFFRHESCGQCVPCRVGTQRQVELLDRLAAGRPLGGVAQERALHRDLAQVMADASICGLGQAAAAAVASVLDELTGAGERAAGRGRDER